VARVAAGNFLEMYDFMVFGYYAAAVGRAFFPAKDAFASTMAALMTFGAGFLMRPLGAVVLGLYADRAGRRQGLLLTLSLMGLGVAGLALTPPFAMIGLAAPVLVVAARLVQGFSAGAELGSASVYLAEIAPPGRTGLIVSFQSASQQAAVVAAAGVGYALAALAPPEALASWAWRLPFLLGCAILPALLILRRGLEESPAFDGAPPAARLSGLWAAWPMLLVGIGLVTMTTVSFYMITAYTPTFGGFLRLRPADAFLTAALVGVSNLLWLPLMGAASDRLGRRPILIAAAGLMLVTAWPALLWLAAAPSLARLLVVELWFSALYGSYNGAMAPYLAALAPRAFRTAGFSLAYSLAAALFGGFTPAVAAALTRLSGSPAAPGAWMSAAAAAGLAALAAAPRLGPPTAVGGAPPESPAA
jgi:MFS family permease